MSASRWRWCSRPTATSPRMPPRWSMSTYEDAPGAPRDCRKAALRRRAAGAPRGRLQHRLVLPDRLRRHRCGVPRRARTCSARTLLAAPRRRPFDRGPRHRGRVPRRRRLAHGLRLDPEGARPVQFARRRCSASTRTACASRRPMSAAASAPSSASMPRTWRWRLRRSSPAARSNGSRTGASISSTPRRSATSTGRWRSRLDARRPHSRAARPPAARSRRLCAAGREPALQLRLDADRTLRGAGLRHGGDRRLDQQGAGVLGARRRLSAGLLRDGAPDGPARARTRPRPRRTATAQPDPGGENALHQAAQDARRRHHRDTTAAIIRPARRPCSPPPAGTAFRAGRRRRAHAGASSASGLAHALKGTGRGPFESGVVRISPSGRVSVFTGAAAIGQGLKTALAQICASELGVGPDDVQVMPGDTAGVPLGLGGFASRQIVTAGNSRCCSRRARSPTRRRSSPAMCSRSPSTISSSPTARCGSIGAPQLGGLLGELVAHPARRARLRLSARHGAGARGSRQFRTDALAYANALPRRRGRGRRRDRRGAHPALRTRCRISALWSIR